MTAPEVSLDDIDWDAGDDSTLFYYDPRFRFPLEELVALARTHARYPGLVHRELRRDMDPDAVAGLFGLEGLGGAGVGVGAGGGSTSSAADAPRKEDAGAGLDKEEPGYVTVDEPGEGLADEYVVVGTADEVERERRREADAEAELEAGFSDQVRAIEELLKEDEEEDAVTAEQKKLIDDIDRFMEEEAARDPGWNTVYRTIEQHFAFTDDEGAFGTPEE
ncbi:unnamed protein product [Urochloa decumbens]|uniref:Uncharacterized protein n=1 Tax=Urochloa decumbens TaxID=240449 RepID=A0ABC9D475_9POAL